MTRKRTDANHAEILRAFRAAGASAVDTSALPKFVDQVVGWCGETVLVEVKKPPGPRGGISDRELTPEQRKLHENWRGGTLVVVDSVEAALRVLRTISRSKALDAVTS